MVAGAHNGDESVTAWRQLIERTAVSLARRRRPQRLLLVSPRPELFAALGETAGTQLITLRPGSEQPGAAVACDSGELPFQDQSIDMVILHHVLRDGFEPEMDEARRILAGGGDLLVLGTGSLNWRSLAARTGPAVPALQVARVCRELEFRRFRIEACSGLLAGRLRLERNWHRFLLPLCDPLAIRCRRHRVQSVVTPMKFGRPQVAGVQTAAIDGLNRRALS